MTDAKPNLNAILFADGTRLVASKIQLDATPNVGDVLEFTELTGSKKHCDHCGSTYDETVKRKYSVTVVAPKGYDWVGLGDTFQDRKWDVIETHPSYDHYSFMTDLGVDWTAMPETLFVIVEVTQVP